jgi:signal transduction histidine kinase
MPSPSVHDRRIRWASDVVLAVVLGALTIFATRHIEVDASSDRAVSWLAITCVVVAAVGVAFWRTLPWVGCGLGLLATWTYTVGRFPGGPIYVLGALAIYGLAVTLPRRRAYALAGAIGIAYFATSLIARQAVQWNDLLFFVWPFVAVLVADVVRGQRERTAAEEAQRIDVARRAEVEASRRRAEERLALARDLHDSVAHAMATINVQAGVAAHVLGRDQDQTAEALESIRLASRDVLDELRVMLDVLREGEGAPRQPVADLAQLGGLVESSRRAGVDVEVRHEAVDGVPPPISAAAYRVVQEGLTNVARHAPGAHAVVVVSRPAGTVLAVEVRDDGPGDGTGSSAPGAGVGLVGVRERAAVTGGRYEIGPGRQGGFMLRVVWDDPASDDSSSDDSSSDDSASDHLAPGGAS